MSKVTDKEVLKVLQDPGYKSDSARCIALDITPNGGVYKRFRRLRAEHGIAEPVKKKKPDMKEPPKTQLPEEIMGKPIAQALKFDEIKKDDRLTRNGKRLIVVAIDDKEMTLQRMDCSFFTLTRAQFEHTEGYSKTPSGDPRGGPVTTYYIEPGTEIAGGGPDLNQLPQTGSGGGGSNKKPLFEDIDYTDPAWGVAKERPRCVDCRKELTDEGRGYLDRIDQLLQIMVPECRKNPLMVVDVKAIAMAMLERGFDEEVRE